VVSKLAPFEPYLLSRWKEGCHNASALMREIVARGYRDGASILRQRLQEWRRIMPETPRGPQYRHSIGKKRMRLAARA
jgi:transposase